MKKKSLLVLIYAAVFAIGCARVEVQAPKDPIKMDIAMRLDVYQHVVKDIDEIENIVSGGSPAVKQLSGLFIATAYADDLPPAAREAALRRRDRKGALDSYKSQGVIGENASGLVEVKSANGEAQSLVQAENSDRMIIYQAIAQKNGTSVESVQEVYAKRYQ